MARKRKAVDHGSSRNQLKRTCRADYSADAAKPSDVGKAPPAMASTTPKPKRNPRRAVKDRWEEEKLMTSDTSQLVDLDIVKLLAHPRAWDCLEEAEKQEILNLLPIDTHPNPHHSPENPDAKIPRLPDSFLRYSNHWRDGIRQFQIDLQNGRYDPGWLREAEEAMASRAAGQFDKFKEQEFEEFWGQKQKLDRSLAAGQSSQVKLSTLIENGLVQKGDVWKFSRSFSRAGQKILVEKEARVIEINGFNLTFAVPPGERVFLNTITAPDTKASPVASPPLTNAENTTPPAVNSAPESKIKADQEPSSSSVDDCLSKRPNSEIQPEAPLKRRRGRPRKIKPEVADPNPENTCEIVVEVVHQHPAPETTPPSPEKKDPTVKIGNGNQTPADKSPIIHKTTKEVLLPQSPPAGDNHETANEIIISNIQGPTALCNKILEVDGRIKEIPNGNAWKEIRSYRNNQDMGSLWEIRQAWFFRGK